MRRTHVLKGALAALVLAAPVAAQEHEHEEMHEQHMQSMSVEYLGGRPGGAFSEAVRVGNTLYLTGKLGTAPGQGLVEGGIQAETRQTLTNISEALARYGSSMDEVVKCTVFLADMAEWSAMNQVYVEFFPINKPSRSAVGVNGLALDARVEIECIAVTGENVSITGTAGAG